MTEEEIAKEKEYMELYEKEMVVAKASKPPLPLTEPQINHFQFLLNYLVRQFNSP